MDLKAFVESGLGDDIEFKVRHVRTPDGAKRYGLPIGSPILPGMKPGVGARNMAILKLHMTGNSGAVRTPRPKDLGGGVEGVSSDGIPFTSGTGPRTRAPLVGSRIGNDETVVESSPLRFVTKSSIRKGLRIYERDDPNGSWKWVNKRGSGKAASGSARKEESPSRPMEDPKRKAEREARDANFNAMMVERRAELDRINARRGFRPDGTRMTAKERAQYDSTGRRLDSLEEQPSAKPKRSSGKAAPESAPAAAPRVTKPMKTFYNAQSRGDKAVLTRAIRAGRVTNVAEMRALLRGRKTR